MSANSQIPSRKYLLAVSGGVDSVVLLDILAKTKHEIIVAHFDHGIRENSAADARFVALLADKYQLEYVGGKAELGESASEEKARIARYDFLFAQAKRLNATVVTAHHLDDLTGSIAINIIRGTGWRGLAVMNRPGISRPLLRRTKKQIYDYALKNRLEWVEDATNVDTKYLRNSLKTKLNRLLDETKNKLLDLRAEQQNLVAEIDQEAADLMMKNQRSRYMLSMVPGEVGRELLRTEIANFGGQTPTKNQADLAILAIKTYQSGKAYQIGSGVKLSFDTKNFSVITTQTK